MADKNWLAIEEEAMLKQPESLVDSVRRGRIIKKVGKSLSTLDAVASFNYNKIDYDKLWQPYKLSSFLRALVRHDNTKPHNEETTKLLIAGDLIKIGLEYYTDTFSILKAHKEKIEEMKATIDAINEIIQIERDDKKYSKLYAMRKGYKFPPDVKEFGMAHEYRARCDICWHWSTGITEQEAVKSIRHHDNCNYKETTLENCIRVFNPRETKEERKERLKSSK